MAEWKAEGIILNQMDLGEHDRIYTILTAQLGRIRAVAKGIKRKKSALAPCGLFLYGEFILLEGRELYYIKSVSTISEFFGLSAEVESFALACYFSKLAQAVSAEKMADQAILKLLLNTYYTLEKRKIPFYIVKAVFELKLSELAGFMPSLSQCTSCGKTESKVYYYSAAAGGVLCEACVGRYSDHKSISPAVLQAIRYIVISPLKEAFRFHLAQEYQEELAEIAQEHANYYIPGGQRALDYYKTCVAAETTSLKLVRKNETDQE